MNKNPTMGIEYVFTTDSNVPRFKMSHQKGFEFTTK